MWRTYDGWTTLSSVDKVDSSWTLLSTDNSTFWFWQHEAELSIDYTSNGDPSFLFPLDTINVTFCLASNISQWFSSGGMVSNHQLSINQEKITTLPSSYASINLDYLPDVTKVNLIITHDAPSEFITFVIYGLFIVLLTLLGLLIWLRKRIDISNVITIASSILVFLPILLFTFRASIAPAYLTLVDMFGFVIMLFYGFLLLSKIIESRKKKEDPLSYDLIGSDI